MTMTGSDNTSTYASSDAQGQSGVIRQRLQHADINAGIHGALGGTLGMGNRTAPDYRETVSFNPHPEGNLSGGQFAAGHARSSMLTAGGFSATEED